LHPCSSPAPRFRRAGTHPRPSSSTPDPTRASTPTTEHAPRPNTGTTCTTDVTHRRGTDMTNERQVQRIATATASRIIGHELTRRGCIGATVAAGTAGLLAACTPAGQPGTAPAATGGPLESGLSIYTWGDYDDPELLTQFTSEKGPQ